jgi:hypothetical protein
VAEGHEWSESMGLHVRAVGALLLHLLPCVGSLLHSQRDRVVFQGSGTSGCQNLRPPRTISHDYSYQGLKTYSKRETI